MKADRMILGEGSNAVFSTDCNETGLNNNVIVCASSGGGKTMSIMEPRLLETFHSSLIVTCTKRRIVDKYRDVFQKRGYTVQDLNFVKPAESNVAYDPLAYVSSYSDITFLAESIVKANPRKDNTTADPYWDDASVSLLSALISYVLMTEDNPTFADVLKLNDSLTITEGGSRIETSLDSKFARITQKDPHCFAVTCWNSFKVLPIKTASCVYGTLNTTIDTIFSPELRKMISSKGKVDFEEIANHKTVLFITTSAVNPALNCFINMFYAQMFKQLFEYAESLPSGKLPIPVSVLADDFATGSRILNFPEYISIFREKLDSVIWYGGRQGDLDGGTWHRGGKFFGQPSMDSRYIITAEVYDQIKRTIGTRKPEQGGILGSSDGIHIDHYYFDKTADRTSASYTMDAKALNEVIHGWNDNGIQLVGIIHSHPQGCTKPSYGDMETARHIIETIDVKGKFFTPIVQVSPKLNGDIKIYPYTFEQTVELKEQPLTIQEASPEALEEKRRRELAKKAPNRFKRIESVFPGNLMSKKTVICIGCGGSRPFLETLARCGVGTFYLVDGDVVEDTNIATQGTYISEIGKLKTEVIRDRIMDINPMAKVVCINKFLDDEMTDNEFAYMTGLVNCRKSDTLLCGCTDNFYAQDRCAQLSVKYGVPYLAAQIYAGGSGHEVIFSYPGVTQSCPRCMLESRYKKELTSSGSGTGSSAGAAVCVTDYLNSIKSYVAISILCYSEKSTQYYHALDKLADRNYLMTRCSDTLKAPAFDPLDVLATQETDLSFPYATIAIGQTPEHDCPLCGGHGRLELMEGRILDTRRIPNKYSA